MDPLSQASSALKDLKKQVISSSDSHQLGEDEKQEAETARIEANEAIDAVRKMIASALGKHHASSKPPGLQSRLTHSSSASARDVNREFKAATMTNLKTVADTAKVMSSSIKNIMNEFNTILSLSGLDEFSGTLESAPAVGVLNNTVQYVGLSLNEQNNVQPHWSVLDNLPEVPGSGNTTNLFSYQGAFFVAIGQHLWEKPTKNLKDPLLYQAATNKWADMYHEGWLSKGACLPTTDIKDVIPWSHISEAGNTLTIALFILNGDGTLSFSTSIIGPNMSFTPLKPATGTTAVTLTHSAYWNNAIWGVDADNILYKIVPTLSESTYTLESQNTLSNTITDLTAVDTGLLAARSDGNLYRLITDPPKDKTSPPTQTWKLYMSLGGVRNLGAASPGIILDLKTLTIALKASYTDTQTNLFPYVNQILAFCASHKVYLGNLMEAAKKWQATTDPNEKAKIEREEGQISVQHAQVLSRLLSASFVSANDMVVDMARQTAKIDSSIAAQLVQIDKDMEGLKASINEAEQQEKVLTAALWASIAAVIVGIGLAVAAFFFPPAAIYLWIGAGALVLGGVVSVGVISSKLSTLSSALKGMRTQLENLTKAKTELTTIRGSYTNLTEDYGQLLAFWLEMYSVSQQIEDLTSLGTFLLEDQSSITAAENLTQEIVMEFRGYIRILGEQGIKPRTSTPSSTQELFLEQAPSIQLASLRDHIASQNIDHPAQVQAKLSGVHQLMLAAVGQLAGRDHAGYNAIMSNAVRLNDHIHKPHVALV